MLLSPLFAKATFELSSGFVLFTFMISTETSMTAWFSLYKLPDLKAGRWNIRGSGIKAG